MKEFQENLDTEHFTEYYKKEILGRVSVNEVLNDLDYIMRMSGGSWKDVCFLCWERPEKFCHRHLVAEWLREGNVFCKEWSEYPSLGYDTEIEKKDFLGGD